MSWLFSQALVEEFSAGTSLAGQPCAQLNVMPTPHKFWRADKMIEHCDHSRFGLTSQLLTDAHGAELLTSFLAAFPVKISARLEMVPDFPAHAADYGSKCGALFATYSLNQSMWKTVQCSLLGDLEEFSETWPRWGSMRNGESFLRQIPVLPICESVSGLWQTPVADDAIERKDGKWNSRGEPKLSAEVKIWPTPNALPASNDLKLKCSGDGRVKPNKLGWAVSESGVDGLLNPVWVEWLMGWPIGWTDLKPLETARFREWRQQHGDS